MGPTTGSSRRPSLRCAPAWPRLNLGVGRLKEVPGSVMATKRERIIEKAIELLDEPEAGLRYSELVAKLEQAFPHDPHGTITGSVWNLDVRVPDRVYKPSRGLFRLCKYRPEQAPPPTVTVTAPTPGQGEPIKEVAFYEPFKEFLVNDLEECTAAISLGGNKFGNKWGTPDVFGVSKSRESDIVKMPLEVVSAEVKIDTGQLITAFGQACAYKLFSHRSYLVVPRGAQPEDIGRLDALCTIFGIGLILFDATQPLKPNFQIRVRAAKHEPDSFYVNQNVRTVANELGL
jgi:hypothetical protein